MGNIQVILYQAGNCADFLPALIALRENDPPVSLAVLSKEGGSEDIAAQCEVVGFKRTNVKFQFLPHPDLWPEAVNKIVGAASPNDYAFLVANTVQLAPNVVAACLAVLEQDKKLQGASPVLIDGSTDYVAHLGTVVDSASNLHYLYEGMAREHPLAHKRRFFQFAHPAAVLLRNSAFHAAGGFKPQLDSLFFLSFCATLAQRFGPCFAVALDAVAVWQRDARDLLAHGTWNSYADLGKIPVGIVAPDFHKHAAADGMEYAVSQWLGEDAVNHDLWDQADPWLAWRHTGSPIMLMRWLGNLHETVLPSIVPIIQSCPCFFPKQLRRYEVLAQRLAAFAQKHGLQGMQADIIAWQKKIRSFHYRELAPAMRLMQRAGIYNASLDRCAAAYDAWLELAPEAREQRLEIGENWPRIAVAMPVYNPDPQFLNDAIQSVRRQTYADWRLCIADDASTNPEIQKILEAFARADERIKIDFRKQNGHICRATNSAIALADAPFIAFMDHDDMLAPDALAAVAKEIAQDGDLKLVYTDSDHIDAYNIRRFPYFKADYNAEMHGSYHLSVYAMDSLQKAGLFRPGTEGSQDQDIFLRVAELCEPAQIKHIPRILYHWRVHAGSVAGSIGAKPYVLAATEKLKNDMAGRRGIKAHAIKAGVNHFFWLHYEPRPDISCALVIMRESGGIDDRLLASLQNLDNFCKCSRYIVAVGAGEQYRHFATVSGYETFSCEYASWPEACNAVAQGIREDIILFVSSALRPLPGCQPGQLALQAALPQKGMVGSLFWRRGCLVNGGYYPNIDGKPFALMRGMRKDDLPSCCYGDFVLPHTVIGMDWRAFAVSRQTFLANGGFDSAFGSWANIDFCLRLSNQGFSNLVSPFGQWEIAEAPPEESTEDAGGREFQERWQKSIAANGLRNPNLEAAYDNDWRLRF